MSDTIDVRTYGNLRRPKRPGLLGFSGLATAIGLSGIGLALLVTMAGQQVGLGFSALTTGGGIAALTMALILPTRSFGLDDRSGYDRAGAWLLGKLHRNEARALQGPTGFTPDGACRLPGLMSSSRMLRARTPYGEEFGVIHLPAVGHYSVVMEGASEGGQMSDQSAVDSAVAHWGATLAFLGQQRDVVGAQVVVETAPDPGLRLRAAVQRERSPHAPDAAISILDAVVDEAPRGQATITTRLAVTFSAKDKGGSGARKRTDAQMAERIQNLAPALLGQVRMAGAGMGCRLMGADEITDAIRVCFDPSVAADVEEAQLTDGGTGLRWDEAGPVRWEPHDRYVRHDRAYSTTVQMVAPPSGGFYSDVLRRLLKPHPDVMRKRVAIMYRPHDPISAAREVEADVNATMFEGTKKAKGPSARQQRDYEAAKATEREEAMGAGLIRFGIAITGTGADLESLRLVDAALEELTAAARLRIRFCLGNQAAGFLSTLPLGLVLPVHKRIPDESDRRL